MPAEGIANVFGVSAGRRKAAGSLCSARGKERNDSGSRGASVRDFPKVLLGWGHTGGGPALTAKGGLDLDWTGLLWNFWKVDMDLGRV